MSDLVDMKVGFFYFGRHSFRQYGFVDHEKKEISNSVKEIILRTSMPYGMYICDDGREVIFNRDYAPIWSRHPNQYAMQASPNEVVKDIKNQIWFWPETPNPWNNSTVKKRCEKVLLDFFCRKDVLCHRCEP